MPWHGHHNGAGGGNHRRAGRAHRRHRSGCQANNNDPRRAASSASSSKRRTADQRRDDSASSLSRRSSSSSSSSSSRDSSSSSGGGGPKRHRKAVALSARALQAGAAVAAAYGHVIGRDEAAAIVARAEAEGADDSETSDGLPAGTVVADRFALGRVLGSGGFGVVYEAVDMADPRRTRVAIKMEKGVHRVRSLRHEATVFEALKGGPGVPPVLWSGSVSVGDGQRADILVMPLLGDSLYDSMRKRRRGHFSPQTVMSIARRVLRYLEHMHARGWLHRDIKPHNFLLDRSRANLFIIDFGLAKRWCDPRTGTHIDYERRSNRSSVPGTAKYASLNTHEGVVQSRRDDLEALAYTLVQMAKGSLPWDNVPGQNKAKRCARIRESKGQKNAIEIICEGLPSCFARFLAYARSLNFAETPDYGYCRALFAPSPAR